MNLLTSPCTKYLRIHRISDFTFSYILGRCRFQELKAFRGPSMLWLCQRGGRARPHRRGDRRDLREAGRGDEAAVHEALQLRRRRGAVGVALHGAEGPPHLARVPPLRSCAEICPICMKIDENCNDLSKFQIYDFNVARPQKKRCDRRRLTHEIHWLDKLNHSKGKSEYRADSLQTCTRHRHPELIEQTDRRQTDKSTETLNRFIRQIMRRRSQPSCEANTTVQHFLPPCCL